MSIDCVGKTMSWGEAWRLTLELAKDPSSSVAAAFAGWPYPWSWETELLACVRDSIVRAFSKKSAKPYPRPWEQVKRVGKSQYSRKKTLDILQAAKEGRLGPGKEITIGG